MQIEYCHLMESCSPKKIWVLNLSLKIVLSVKLPVYVEQADTEYILNVILSNCVCKIIFLTLKLL